MSISITALMLEVKYVPRHFHQGCNDQPCYQAFPEQHVLGGLGNIFCISYDSSRVTVISSLSQKYIQWIVINGQ